MKGWEIIWDYETVEIASKFLDDLRALKVRITPENRAEIRSYIEEWVEQMERELEFGGYETEKTNVDDVVECIFWLNK